MKEVVLEVLLKYMIPKDHLSQKVLWHKHGVLQKYLELLLEVKNIKIGTYIKYVLIFLYKVAKIIYKLYNLSDLDREKENKNAKSRRT